MLLIQVFLTMYINSRAVIKIDVINSSMHRSEHYLVCQDDVSLCFGTGILKTYTSFMRLCFIVIQQKFKLSKSFIPCRAFYLFFTTSLINLII